MCDFIEIATPFKACCEADGQKAALDKAKERSPNLVIVDLSMPMLNGVETACALREVVPEAKIIGLSMMAGDVHKPPPGFDMIVSKRQGLAKLAEAIRRVLPDAYWT